MSKFETAIGLDVILEVPRNHLPGNPQKSTPV